MIHYDSDRQHIFCTPNWLLGGVRRPAGRRGGNGREKEDFLTYGTRLTSVMTPVTFGDPPPLKAMYQEPLRLS
jgi:hypothetical protein